MAEPKADRPTPPRPYYLTTPCPLWCDGLTNELVHRSEAHPTERKHVAVNVGEVVLSQHVSARPDALAEEFRLMVSMEQPVRQADPDIVVWEECNELTCGELHDITMTVDEAAVLARHLAKFVRLARRAQGVRRG